MPSRMHMCAKWMSRVYNAGFGETGLYGKRILADDGVSCVDNARGNFPSSDYKIFYITRTNNDSNPDYVRYNAVNK